MIDIKKILYNICEEESVYEDNCELIESGILDSFAIISLLSELEDLGINIELTQIDRTRLKTPKLIQELVEEYSKK